jgi:hypothetical protein
MLQTFVSGVFTPVLAKHPKWFSLIAGIPVTVDRMRRNFEPMRKQWQRRVVYSFIRPLNCMVNE